MQNTNSFTVCMMQGPHRGQTLLTQSAKMVIVLVVLMAWMAPT